MVGSSFSSNDGRKPSSPYISFKGKFIVVALTLLVVLLCIAYLLFEWNRYQGGAEAEAVQLGQSLESLLHHDHISALAADSGDLEKNEYALVKSSLMQLAEATDSIRFAYLLVDKDGEIDFLADSEPSDSPDYSAPGQVYEEASEWDWKPFLTGQTVITPPLSDRWGAWVSVLVPVVDSDTGETIAVFGMDYSQQAWYASIWMHMIPDFIVAVVILFLYFSMLLIWLQHFRLSILNRRLTLDEALYRSVFEQAPIGIAIMEGKSHVVQTELGDMTINSRYKSILGRSKEELKNTSWVEMTHPDDLEADLAEFDRFKKGDVSQYAMEKRFIRPDGTAVWVKIWVSPLLGLDSGNTMHLALVEDISARKQAEEALSENERREAVLLSHLPGMAYRRDFDSGWKIQYISDGCLALTGYAPSSLLENGEVSYDDLISSEYRESVRGELLAAVHERRSFKCEYEITTARRERRWVLEMGEAVYGKHGKVEALEGIVLDITDRKKGEDRLKYMSEHDRWTGLYNLDALEGILKAEDRKTDTLKRAVLNVNLSTVRLVAANYGFFYARFLVKKAADSLGKLCSEKRMLFNPYENHFVFYIVGYEDRDELAEFGKQVAEALEFLFRMEMVGGGIGILEIGESESIDIDSMLKKLLVASEKSMGVFEKDFQICFYDAQLEELDSRESEVQDKLSEVALSEKYEGLFLQYQPIWDYETNSVCCFEALARLEVEGLGLVSPAEFIPIGEKTKLIIPIGEKVALEALAFLRRLEECGFENMNVAINVSAIQLLRTGYAANLMATVDKMHLDPQNIDLEITESVFTSEYELINGILGELKEAGFNISIDDFGMGYSSLSRVDELNVDCIKIDKSFIDKIAAENDEDSIAPDIISMAHKKGYRVIAEGVESECQMAYLADHGCDEMQGYLLGEPMDGDRALDYLSRPPRQSRFSNH